MRNVWIRLVVWVAKKQFPFLMEIEKLLISGLAGEVRTSFEKAEDTKSRGADKQVFVATAVRALYRKAGITEPLPRDVNLLIELIVRGF